MREPGWGCTIICSEGSSETVAVTTIAATAMTAVPAVMITEVSAPSTPVTSIWLRLWGTPSINQKPALLAALPMETLAQSEKEGTLNSPAPSVKTEAVLPAPPLSETAPSEDISFSLALIVPLKDCVRCTYCDILGPSEFYCCMGKRNGRYNKVQAPTPVVTPTHVQPENEVSIPIPTETPTPAVTPSSPPATCVAAPVPPCSWLPWKEKAKKEKRKCRKC
jgi:hypothetical protein